MYKKKLPCPFCDVLQSKLTRHIERQHQDEAPVENIMKASTKLEGTALLQFRRKQYKLLALKGCNQHNARVRQLGGKVADIIPAKKMCTELPVGYLECPDCYGLYKNVTRHQCLEVKSERATRAIKKRARTHMIKTVVHNDLLADILASARDGEEKQVILKDELLLSYGENRANEFDVPSCEEDLDDEDDIKGLATKITAEELMKNTIRQELRMLARYVLEYRRKFRRKLSLADIFTKQYYQYTVGALEKLTGGSEFYSQYGLWATLLRKVYDFAKSKLSKERELVPRFRLNDQLKRFGELISFTQALKRIEEPACVPRWNDLQKFRAHVCEKLAELATKSKHDFDYTGYKEYCGYTVARIALFNLRRSGEVATMSEEQFAKRQSVLDLDQLPINITEEQYEQAQQLRVVPISGEDDEQPNVFLVLTAITTKAILRVRIIKHLLKQKGQFPYADENPFVFATKGEKQWHVAGHMCFKEIAKILEVENITAGSVRRLYAANIPFEPDYFEHRLLSCVLRRGTNETFTELYKDENDCAAARFFHVPVLLTYLEQQNGVVGETFQVTLPDMETDAEVAPAEPTPAANTGLRRSARLHSK